MKSALSAPKNAPNSSVNREECAPRAPSVLRRILRENTPQPTTKNTKSRHETEVGDMR